MIEPTLETDCLVARLSLDCGAELAPATIRYVIYGSLNERRDNAVLVCHALSGSARVGDWWPELLGEAGVFDLNEYCVIGSNVIGSCYGSSGPRSINPTTGAPYDDDFPLVTVRDMVRAQAMLADNLGINSFRVVIGGSIGGMQALQWAADYPNRVQNCVAIGATPLSAMGLALNHVQRRVIQLDPKSKADDSHQGTAGIGLARMIAMCTYKSAALFDERFGRKPDRSGEDPFRSSDGRFDIAGYLDYQAKVFMRRFDPRSYIVLSKAMDTFELGRTSDEEQQALRRITSRVLLVGIASDWLFPAEDIQALVERMRRARVQAHYAELQSTHGHDAFLAEPGQFVPKVRAFLDDASNKKPVHAEVASMPAAEREASP